MDPVDLAYWIDAVYSSIVCSGPDDFEFRDFYRLWFEELVTRRGRPAAKVI